jgi:hypothetical protein
MRTLLIGTLLLVTTPALADGVRVLPTAQINLGVPFAEDAGVYGLGWAGIALYGRDHRDEKPRRYVAVGVEADLGGCCDGAVLDLRPAVRLGWSVFAEPRSRLPLVGTYLAASLHAPSERRGTAVRLTIGVESPLFARYFLPGSFGFTFEVGDQPGAGVLYGYGF